MKIEPIILILLTWEKSITTHDALNRTGLLIELVVSWRLLARLMKASLAKCRGRAREQLLRLVMVALGLMIFRLRATLRSTSLITASLIVYYSSTLRQISTVVQVIICSCLTDVTVATVHLIKNFNTDLNLINQLHLKQD